MAEQRTPIPMAPVASTMFDAIGHDPIANTLAVRMKNGKTYHYAGVTAEQHGELMNAKSMGQHFGAAIRGKFDHSIIEEPASDVAKDDQPF